MAISKKIMAIVELALVMIISDIVIFRKDRNMSVSTKVACGLRLIIKKRKTTVLRG